LVPPAIEGARIKPLAITSLQRSAQFPEYKTVSESGLKGFEVIVWYGLFAPAGTPAAVVNRLNAEIRKITALPDVQKRLLTEGAEPMNASPQEFAARIQSDYEKWNKVVEAAGAKIE
jgi:tripartite-type tricarboxylate transporter receptor subunit TctC